MRSVRTDWARRLGAIALAALLACCARPAPPPPAATVAPPQTCQVGPDGGPMLAERGIGGTGGPALADRGIGGTGGPAGIVGVITGFASVCLAGQEIALPQDVAVTTDSAPASAASLRAGQVAAVQTDAALRARRITLRYEVSGPVENLAGDRLVVAGQDVLLGPDTWGITPRPGQWVTVSGLRRADGVIVATRVDPREPGAVLVHGTLRRDAGQLRIGNLIIHPAPGLEGLIGTEVTASGVLNSGVLVLDSVVPDLLAMDPAAYFGPAVGVFYLEGFVLVEGGRVGFGHGFSALAPGLRTAPGGRAVLRLERGAQGLRATQATPFAGLNRFSPVRRFEPAPVPNRSTFGPAERGARSGPGFRPGGRAPSRPGFGSPDQFGHDAPGPGTFGPGPSTFGPGPAPFGDRGR
jgi:hypothetical protein